MPAEKTKLVSDLAALPDTDWFDVLEQAKSQRQMEWEKQFPYRDPAPDMNRAQFTEWVALRHLASDPFIREVYTLDHEAPADEIRLVEVNTSATLPEEMKAEAIDFSVNVAGLPYKVFVADVTPAQWQRIQQDARLLPDGWSLRHLRRFDRNGR